MGERATTILIMTFTAGVGWGAWLGPSPRESSTSARSVSKATEAPRAVSSFLKAPEREQDRTFVVTPVPERTMEKPDEVVEDFEHEEVIGVSAEDALLALERRYQELLKDLTATAEKEKAEEEALRQVEEPAEEPQQLSFKDEVLPEVIDQPVLVEHARETVPRFEQGEGQQFSAEVINIHNQQDHSETNNQQVIVVQSQLPYYGGFAANNLPTQASETAPETQPQQPPPFAPWAQTRPSQTNPWAPIDYSTHHNPYSLMISGKSSSLPRVGGSGLSIIYRR